MRRLMVALVLLAPNALAAQEIVSEKPLRHFGTTNLRQCSAAFAFAPDGSAIAVVPTANDTSVLIHDCRTGALRAKLDVGAVANALSYSPGGQRLLASSSNGQTTLLELATGKKLSGIWTKWDGWALSRANRATNRPLLTCRNSKWLCRSSCSAWACSSLLENYGHRC